MTGWDMARRAIRFDDDLARAQTELAVARLRHDAVLRHRATSGVSAAAADRSALPNGGEPNATEATALAGRDASI